MPLVLTLIILNTNTVKVLGYASEDLGYASCVNTNHFKHLPTDSIKLLALAL